MPFALEQMTQGLSVADVLNSQSVNNASIASTGLDMSKFRRAMYIVQAASIGAAGTLDGRLQSAAAANFATPHNIAGTNLTQINTSTTPSNNAVATIEVRDDQLQAGDRYLRIQLTGGGNAITVGAIGLGGEGDTKPANLNDVNNTFLSQRIVK